MHKYSLFYNDTLVGHIDRRLKANLILYYTIILLTLAVNIYEIVIGSISIILSLGCMLCWFFLGVISHRIFNIKWHHDERKVIGNMDRLGLTILIAYTVFALCRYSIIEYYFRGELVVAITLAVYGGITLGRVVGMRRRIFQVLKQHNIIR